MSLKNRNVQQLLFSDEEKKRRDQIHNNRQIVNRVVEIIIFIGKQGLSYRGSTAEAAYDLNNPFVNHGNFLELLFLLDKYDPLLSAHLKSVQEDSSIAHRIGSKGRGSLLTFISKAQ